LEDGKKKPRIKPHEEEEDWNWRNYQYNKQIEEEEDIKIENDSENYSEDLENIEEGEENG
jgi:hypothetical protein